MINTQSMKVKAVTCLTCKYTDFTRSDLCKQRKHEIKWIDAIKRFFRCKRCKRRISSLDKLPKTFCQCGEFFWEKVGMVAEKKGPKLESEMLSIRGNEENRIGCVTGTANINS